MGIICSNALDDTCAPMAASVCCGIGDGTESPQQHYQQQVVPERCVLILGAGDSGKSTIFKHLQHLYSKSFRKPEDRLNFKSFIIDNVITAIQILVTASHHYKIPIQDPNNRATAAIVSNLPENIFTKTDKEGWNCLPHGLTPTGISALWQDVGIQEVFKERNLFHLDDNAPYFLSKLGELTRKGYVPSLEDILRSRKKTVGVADEIFDIQGRTLKVVDVGGQRNERRKWISFFSGMDAVVYVSSLSEYDQLTYENDKTPRLDDSTNVFKSFFEVGEMSHVPVHLVLNKLDVMCDKINRQKEMSRYFKEFNGDDQNVEDYKQFITSKFMQYDTNNRVKGVYYTSAVDEQSIKLLVQRILENVLAPENKISPPKKQDVGLFSTPD